LGPGKDARLLHEDTCIDSILVLDGFRLVEQRSNGRRGR
jgi:hypothetical protein